MRKLFLIILSVALLQSATCGAHRRNRRGRDRQQEGEEKIMTGNDGMGSVWPKPKSMSSTNQAIPVASELVFKLSEGSKTCDILTDAFERYEKLIRKTTNNYKIKFRPRQAAVLQVVYVTLTSECENFPSSEMKESYSLSVQPSSKLQSDSIWGILRGLETFSQLLWAGPTGEVMVNSTVIEDEPRFSHRGLLIDSARHYLPLYTVYQVLDGMAYNKMNVLHWHIVDDQAFPFVSATFPDLSFKGAYNPATHVYTRDDVQGVIYYARQRGIRVVPEFDTPGHSLSWGKSQPELLTKCCSDVTGKFNGNYGPIDPTREENYSFIKKLWTELKQVFPDGYIHLGGDEVSFQCWKSNPNITAWMKKNNMEGDYAKLEQTHIQKVINISTEVGFSYIVWQEVIDNGIKANEDTVVEVWLPPNDKELEKVTGMGYKALLSGPWYLDYISYGKDWENYYKYEPLNFNGTVEQKKLVLGGEACLWAEYVDSTNILSRLWPRASAVAERLWSQEEVNDVDEATPRLHQHRCRMLKYVYSFVSCVCVCVVFLLL